VNRFKIILPVIVISQFCCTSLWFAGNAVMDALVTNFNLNASALGHLTSAVQFGFIVGTLVFAILTIADRFSPSKIFFISALLGALCNVFVIWESNSLATLLLFRFLTGFFLAGIYPVGMKIATDYYEKGLGKSLGFLVGALVIGTAFPHLLNGMTGTFEWESVIVATSLFALFGGVLMLVFVPNGPYRKQSSGLDLSAFFKVFRSKTVRNVAFGYFGHMWELYAFWAFVPLMLKTYSALHPQTIFDSPVLSFLVIAIGGLACVLGGYLAQLFGTKKIAFVALLLSCGCCLVFPWMLTLDSENVFVGFLFFWGMVVIADSPLFSTLIAQNVTPELKGTALTIINCIGFSITIISIQIISGLNQITDSNTIYLLLALGPILGLIALKREKGIPTASEI
jgi:MFS family permease